MDVSGVLLVDVCGQVSGALVDYFLDVGANVLVVPGDVSVL